MILRGKQNLMGGKAEQRELVAAAGRHAKPCRVELEAFALVEPEAVAGEAEAGRDLFGVGAGSLHAAAEAGLVDLAAVHRAHQAHHPPGLQRRVRVEPFAEQIGDLERQAQHDVGGEIRPRRVRRGKDVFELVIGQRRDHRRRHHPGRDAGRAERGDGVETPRRGRRPRLHAPRQAAVEGGHRDADLSQSLFGHRRQDVDVAQHQGRLGDDADRVVVVAQHLENLAGDALVALDRLIRIGVGAHGQHRALVAALAELLGQQLRRIGLVEQARFEIETRRQAEIGMGRPGEAVDAAMLAAAIGVERAVERHIGRSVARDHRAAGIRRQGGAQHGRRLVGAAPAVIHRMAGMGFEPARPVADRTAALARLVAKHFVHRPWPRYVPEFCLKY